MLAHCLANVSRRACAHQMVGVFSSRADLTGRTVHSDGRSRRWPSGTFALHLRYQLPSTSRRCTRTPRWGHSSRPHFAAQTQGESFPPRSSLAIKETETLTVIRTQSKQCCFTEFKKLQENRIELSVYRSCSSLTPFAWQNSEKPPNDFRNDVKAAEVVLPAPRCHSSVFESTLPRPRCRLPSDVPVSVST